MNKIKRLVSYVFIFVVMIVLASCSKTEFEGDITLSSTRSKITANVTLGYNSKIEEGKAKAYLKLYLIDDGVEEYESSDKTLSFGASYTSSTAEFTNLVQETEYKVYLYVTYNGKDYKIDSETITTKPASTEEAPEGISNVDELIGMANDPSGHYELLCDIDFEGATMNEIFTSSTSKQFTGTFDGNGYTISNFKLKSLTNIGVFGYIKNAKIKNLNLENVTGDFSTGRSTANIGALCGSAYNSVIENCTVNGFTLTIQQNSSATINCGGLIGLGENVSIKNSNVENANITFTRSRYKTSLGLFAGKLTGIAVDNVLVENCYAKGSLTVNCYYPKDGSTYIGGFIGNIGSQSLVNNSYAVADIIVSKYVNSTFEYDFNLAVGGFVGVNNGGSINVTNCLAVADITGYAGAVPGDDAVVDYTGELFSYTSSVKFGGFAGYLIAPYDKIENCYYVAKTNGISVNAKENKVEEDTEVKMLYVENTVGYEVNPDNIGTINIYTSFDSVFDYSSLSEELKAVCKDYIVS